MCLDDDLPLATIRDRSPRKSRVVLDVVDEAVAFMPAPPARNREGACQPLPERIRPRPHAWREELVARLPLEGNVALAVDRGPWSASPS